MVPHQARHRYDIVPSRFSSFFCLNCFGFFFRKEDGFVIMLAFFNV